MVDDDYCVYVLSWMAETAPVCWTRSVEIVRPYAVLVHEHTLSMLDILHGMLQPLTDVCCLYATQLFAVVSCLTCCTTVYICFVLH